MLLALWNLGTSHSCLTFPASCRANRAIDSVGLRVKKVFSTLSPVCGLLPKTDHKAGCKTMVSGDGISPHTCPLASAMVYAQNCPQDRAEMKL